MQNTGVVIEGRQLIIPGVEVRNYIDDPKIRLPREDGMRRPKEVVTCVTLHSTLGAPDNVFTHPQTLLPGNGPSTDVGRALVNVWGTDHRCAGAHLAVDHDSMVFCLQDLLVWETFHATTVNSRSIGIEYRQGRGLSEFYTDQLSAGRRLVTWLCLYFGVQLMVPKFYRNRPTHRLEQGAQDFYGVFGHRDQSNNRGAGDPGDAIMSSIRAAGAEAFDVEANEDKDLWSKRQLWLGFTNRDVDGVPGPKTVAALKTLGFTGGLWVFPPKGLVIPDSLRPVAV